MKSYVYEKEGPMYSHLSLISSLYTIIASHTPLGLLILASVSAQ